VLTLRKKRNWTQSIAQEQRAGNVTDPGACHCRPVVGNDLFLQGGVLHPLPGIPFLSRDGKDHHGVQFHLDVLLLPESILQEVLLQCLGAGRRIPGDHLQYRDPHHLVGDFIFGGNLPLLGDVDHHPPIVVGLQRVHQGGHHLLHDADHLLDTDYQLIDTGPHLQEDSGYGPHLQKDAGYGLHLLEDIGHGLQEDEGPRQLIAHHS